ncbi:murein biosynthesis integral membrane protein MurJ [Thermotalea metallivorans]|uniref:Putative lipid II flippase MurJ n=1 Tax=Thermotalea metallivorans TaxID=520762 RepID=A0A140L1M5_9FIRM|nr:murein biosynthesis integral membrane protein MurJ [Thermotalea metallivorans]KXG74450.1 putative lipid II flippase MurJ [Thermotalea metallivorans]
MSNRRKTANMIFVVFLLTFLAKFIGFFREVLLGSRIGANMASDAYIMAFYATVSIFISVGTAITIAVIPMMVEGFTLGSKEEAFRFSNNLLNTLVLFSTIVIGVVFFFSKEIMAMMANGFEGEKFALTVNLTRIMLPTLICICITYVFVSLLQSMGKFAVTSFISVPANILAIVFLYFFSHPYGVKGLAFVTLVGWVLQFVIQFPSLYKEGFRYALYINLKDQRIRRFFKMIFPVTIVASVNQVNMLLDEIQASALHHGKVSSLYYGGILYLAVAGITVYGISAVMFPKFAEKAIQMERRQYGIFVTSIMKLMIFILLPMTIGIGLLSRPVISLVFERGAFHQSAAAATATALASYSLGMVGYAIQDVVNKAFYALQDIKIPMKFSILAVFLNLLLNVALVRYNEVAGIAFATAGATTLSAVGLYWYPLKEKWAILGGEGFLRT